MASDQLLTQMDVINYMKSILHNSSHCIMWSNHGCQYLAKQIRRPVLQIISFLGTANMFREKHELEILEVTFVDGDKALILSYDNEFKVWCNVTASGYDFDLYEYEDKYWPLDLQSFYMAEGR